MAGTLIDVVMKDLSFLAEQQVAETQNQASEVQTTGSLEPQGSSWWRRAISRVPFINRDSAYLNHESSLS